MKRKAKIAPDWFGCGRKITQESWNAFLEARRAYYADLDAKNSDGRFKAPCLPDGGETTKRVSTQLFSPESLGGKNGTKQPSKSLGNREVFIQVRFGSEFLKVGANPRKRPPNLERLHERAGDGVGYPSAFIVFPQQTEKRHVSNLNPAMVGVHLPSRQKRIANNIKRVPFLAFAGVECLLVLCHIVHDQITPLNTNKHKPFPCK